MATSVSLLLVVACLASLSSAAPEDFLRSLEADSREAGNVFEFHLATTFEQRWQEFREQFGKTYEGSAEEEGVRKKIFAKNLEEIEMHNYLNSKGLNTFTMGVNQFTDLEFSEFLERMTCSSLENIADDTAVVDDPQSDEEDLTLSNGIDWRMAGYVTAVKNQGRCGSCWAFSATGSLEGQNYRRTGKLVELSEQNLIDCSTYFGNRGCNGGLAMMAFTYITWQEGIDTEKSYPYEGKDGRCRFKRANMGATCKGFVRIGKGERKLQRATADYGPISVSIAVTKSFQHYKTGIYYEQNCSSTKLNHAVLVVGYGRQYNTNYWIVKNSWGSTWGDKGYILMSRNRNNSCGIATRPVVPVV